MLGFFKKKDTRSLKFSAAKKMSCFACGLYKEAQSPKMEPYGYFRKKVMVIGEAPGETEDEEGKPFQGKTGRLLQRTLQEIGIDLFEDCIVLNAVNCHPPDNRAPSPNEIKCCRDVKVLKAIEEYKPKMVLLLGNVALNSVVGFRWTAGQLGGINKWSGRTIPDQDYQMWICPVFHPSFVERAEDSPEVKLIWKADLKRAFGCLKRVFPVYKEPNIRYITDLEELRKIKMKEAAFDYEATGLKPQAKGHRAVCASIAYTENDVVAFFLPSKKSERQAFIDFLQSDIDKIASNQKYEDHWSNVRLGSPVKNWIHDTMIWAHVLDYRPGTTSLKFQAYAEFGIMSYEEDERPYLKSAKGSGSNALNRIFNLIEEGGGEQLLKYNALDSIYEFRLAKRQREILDGMTEEERDNLIRAYNLLHEGILALAEAERNGIRIDVDIATKHHKELTKRIDELEIEFKKSKFFKHWQHTSKSVINIDSNPQLSVFLYKIKKLKPKKLTETGQGSTDDEALQSLNIPELSTLLKIRKLKKLRDTYLKAFISESVDGFIHPVFNLHIARTYRSSSDSPNFQNIPVRDDEAKKIIRTCIYPRIDHQLLEVDFKGIEVVVAASYHKDPTMIKYIKDPVSDMHADMAKQIFCLKDFDKEDKSLKKLRGAAKNGFVFPQFYGDYYGNNAPTLSEWSGLPVNSRYKEKDGLLLPSGIHLGAHMINNGIKSYDNFLDSLQDIEHHFWNVRFPVYNAWKKKWFAQYQKKGYFDMYTGFRCSGIFGKNDVSNYPIQGSAFHCLLWSFIQQNNSLKKKEQQTVLIGQIHDSMLLDVHPPELKKILSSVRIICEEKLPAEFEWINCPMTVEAELSPINKSWYDKEPIKLA